MKTNRASFQSRSGQTLVSVLVAAAVGAIVLGFLTDTLVQQGIGQKFITQKIEINDLTNTLSTVLAKTNVCSCQLSDTVNNPNAAADIALLKFNSTVTDGTQSFPVRKIMSGCQNDPNTPFAIAETGQKLPGVSSLVVNEIRFVNLRPVGAVNEWLGQWQISFTIGGGSVVRSVKPILISQKITIDTTSPNSATSAAIVNCIGMSTGTGTENFLSKWSATPGVLEDSLVFQRFPTGNIGIGTTTPNEKLEITGNQRIGQAPSALTTIQGAHTAAVTTITVSSTAGYPTSGTLLIKGEAISYTGKTLNTFTGATRGVLGTTATTFSFPEPVNNYLSTIQATATEPKMVVTGSGNTGIATTFPSFALSVGDGAANDGSIMAQGYGTVGIHGQTLGVSGAGRRMFWYPKLAAFRTGGVDGTQWDDANIGRYSFAAGSDNVASGLRSVAMGQNTTASGQDSTAMGNGTVASGGFSTALGNGSIASGNNSVAMVSSANASGSSSVAIGAVAQATNQHSFAIGYNNIASGEYATALGVYTTAESYSQTTVGRFNMPTGTETVGSWNEQDPIFVVGNGWNSGTNRSNAMMILKNGRVGIGTSAPDGPLDVLGPKAITNFSSDPFVRFKNSNNADTSHTSMVFDTSNLIASTGFGFRVNGANKWDVMVHNDFNFRDSQNANASSLYLKTGGNVGIGNTNPGSLLTVGSSTTRGTVSIFGTGPLNPGALTFSDPSVGGRNFTIYNGISAPGSLFIFDQTAAATRLVVSPAGNIGIGPNTAPSYRLDVEGDINSTTCFRLGGTAVSGACTSDARLKEDIQDFDQGLKELLGIQLHTFRFNGLGEMPKTGEVAVGAIAQEVEKTNPELVKTRMVQMHPEDQTKTPIKTVDYSKFTYMLINAVKELFNKFLGLEKNDVDQNRSITFVKENMAIKTETDERLKRLESENEKLKQENAAIKFWICGKEANLKFCK